MNETPEQEAGQPVLNLQIDEAARSSLKAISFWGMVIVIATLIRYMVIYVDLLISRDATNEYDLSNGELTLKIPASENRIQVFISTLVGLLLCYFLYLCSMYLKRGVEMQHQEELDKGFANLRFYFIVLGIVSMLTVLFFVNMILSLNATN